MGGSQGGGFKGYRGGKRTKFIKSTWETSWTTVFSTKDTDSGGRWVLLNLTVTGHSGNREVRPSEGASPPFVENFSPITWFSGPKRKHLEQRWD